MSVTRLITPDKMSPSELSAWNAWMSAQNTSGILQGSTGTTSSVNYTSLAPAYQAAASQVSLPSYDAIPFEFKPVSLSSQEKEALNTASGLISGKFGNYRQLLSGEADYGHLYSGVINPARRELESTLLPQIDREFAAGPYGATLNTGARRAAKANALSGFADYEAGLRYQEQGRAKELGLQAAQILPQLTGVLDLERQNNLVNLQLQMEAHYKNEALRYQDFTADLQVATQALETVYRASQMALASQELALNSRQVDNAYSLGILSAANDSSRNQIASRDQRANEANNAARLSLAERELAANINMDNLAMQAYLNRRNTASTPTRSLTLSVPTSSRSSSSRSSSTWPTSGSLITPSGTSSWGTNATDYENVRLLDYFQGV